MTAGSRALPAELVRRAREFEEGGAETAPTRDAATVVLLRDAPGFGVEVYLLRRVTSMSFAAGMHVFPGGSVDPRDADAEIAWAGPTAAEWSDRLGAEQPPARALVLAPVRETFEGPGVLLAGPLAGAVPGR